MAKTLIWPIQYAEFPGNSDMERVAARARKRIEEVAVVGITERFVESAALVCAEVGVRPPRDLPRVNVGAYRSGGAGRRYRESIPPDLIERIEAMNLYDIELYRYACELFERQIARFQSHPRRTYCILPELRMALVAPVRRTWRAMDRRWPDFTRTKSVRRVRRMVRRVL